MLPPSVLYDGSQSRPPDPIPLRAGPLTLLFEPEGAFLRYVRLGDREILRGIYAAVRDANWDTVPPRVSALRLEQSEDTFLLTFDVECRQGEIDFFWRGAVAGDAQGTVSFRMDGTARSTFRRNRVGFCVLHPILECAGQPCTVEKADGAVEHGRFPEYISPHQPFLDIRAISHEAAPGLLAEVRFEGDVFQMEDQRNWTDASFKTYCTPLSRPFPVEVPEGTQITQAVTLTLRGPVPAGFTGEHAGSPEILLDYTDTVHPLPRIGLQMAAPGRFLSREERTRLRALSLSHLRVDLRLSEAGWRERLVQATLQAEALGVALEAALFLTDAAECELQALIRELTPVRATVLHWLIFHMAEKCAGSGWVRLAREALLQYDPGTRIGAGTNAYFAEFNRWPPASGPGGPDFVCYSINSQVHAFDNRTLVETLEAQSATVVCARELAGGLPVAVTPVTLKPRFNPNATGPEPETAAGDLPSQVDPRQMSLFGAGWTLGSLQSLCRVAPQSLTFYETTGWLGVMETAEGSPLPDQFPSIPGAVFPLYHLLADAGEFRGGEVVTSLSSDPLRAAGLILLRGDQTRILVANLTGDPLPVRVRVGSPGQVRVRWLDERNAEQAMCWPERFREETGAVMPTIRTGEGHEIHLDLFPYGLARIDSLTPGLIRIDRTE
jgi:D-apionolactonase